MYVRRERNHSQHGHAANILHHFPAVLKQPQVASEFVDDDAFDALAVLLALEHYRAVDACKHSSAVYVRHKNHLRSRMTCHRHVHQVAVP